MWHTLFITIHAVSGVVAFVSGYVTLRRGSLFPLFLGSLTAMAVSLVPALATAWGGLDAVTRVLFAALTGLAAFLVWRAARAGRIRPAAGNPSSSAYIDHVGFALVALVDAFVVVTVLNLGAPGWLIATAGVAIAVAGHLAIQGEKRRRVCALERPSTSRELHRDGDRHV